jgi:hypothetical protein
LFCILVVHLVGSLVASVIPIGRVVIDTLDCRRCLSYRRMELSIMRLRWPCPPIDHVVILKNRVRILFCQEVSQTVLGSIPITRPGGDVEGTLAVVSGTRGEVLGGVAVGC